MFDCSREITSYYNDKVILPEETRAQLREYRRCNQDRLKRGLEESDKPLPKRFVKQGSYAMRTCIQHPENDYDIDDGAVFDPDYLVGPRGGAMSSLDVRKIVCDALQDDRFNRQPEIKLNCVRVYYNEGHHVDIPVYREQKNDQGETYYELAGVEWRQSDPEAVTKWFNAAVIDKSRDDSNGHQMRRIVCLLKAFARSRSSWNMPSGFILSVLADEAYKAFDGRDDESLYQTMKNMHDRLLVSTEVENPVADDTLTDGPDNPRIVQLREKLGWATEILKPTTYASCTREDALKAWKQVFNTDYFDSWIKEEQEKKAKAAAVMAAGISDRPKPWHPNV